MDNSIELQIGGQFDVDKPNEEHEFEDKGRFDVHNHKSGIPRPTQSYTPVLPVGFLDSRRTQSHAQICKSSGLPSKKLRTTEICKSDTNLPFNVRPLLSCLAEMNYLHRNNGEIVELDYMMLTGKYILVCCFHLPFIEYNYDNVDDFDSFYSLDLMKTCSELYSMRDDFEMVVVAKMNELANLEVVFDDFLSGLSSSYLIVPFKDSKRRDLMCEYLGLNVPGCFECLLVNVNRNITLYGDSAIEYLQKLLRVSSMDLLRSYERLIKSIWPVIHKEQNQPCHRQGTCPIARKLKVLIPEYPDDINKIVSESEKSCPIVIGQSFDVISLLSGKGEMNYLDRNDGARVEVEKNTFSGKYILVCCFHAPIFREDFDSCALQALVTTCFDLYSTTKDFEMVVVAKMNILANYEVVFDHFLSGFPSSCLVVPFKDSERRDFICKYLDLVDRCCIRCLLFDKDMDINRNILFCGYPSFALSYGADAFPFTNEKLLKLNTKDLPVWETLSTSKIEGLLGCNPSDILEKINPTGGREEVTISELNEKVVGLYLCVRGNFIPTLQKVYQQCQTQRKAFEIVLVYLPFVDCLDPQVYMVNMDSLLEKHKISWWRLPFNNSVSRRLKRLTCSPNNDKLIIVGAHGAFVEPYGEEVISNYGVDAYPFTREGLVQRELSKFADLTLESLLVYGSRNHVLQGKNEIPVAGLRSRNVLLYLDSLVDIELLDELSRWYYEIKAKDPDFEVVFVRRSNTMVVEDDLVLSGIMPWLVCPFNPDHSSSLEEKIFTKGMMDDVLVEFGKHGRVNTFQARNLLTIHGPGAFPFGDNLRKDVIDQLRNMPMHEFMDNMK